MHRILTFATCWTRLCLRSLHHRYVTWTKPDTTSLLLGTLTGLASGKAELVAENALLRQQLLILQEKQFQRVLRAYVDYFNRARPH
jgi:hypothetical protein